MGREQGVSNQIEPSSEDHSWRPKVRKPSGKVIACFAAARSPVSSVPCVREDLTVALRGEAFD